jgi:HSP20 family molecular chaperone IbpA
MSDIAKRQPGRQFGDWFDWFDSGLPSLSELWRGAFHPIRIEDRMEPDRYVVRAELPGIDPEKDVDVSVEGGVLRVSAERQESTVEKGHSEFRYGSFRRQITLPKGADEDAVQASYRDGILEIVVPISGTTSTTRSIPVSRSRSRSAAGASETESGTSEPANGSSA